MGLAFKCDRCGEYYDQPVYDKGRVIVECTVDKYGTIDRHETETLLCSKCMEAFKKFKTDLEIEYRPTVDEILTEVEQMAISERLSLGKAMAFKEILPSVYRRVLVEKRNKEVNYHEK